MEAHKAAASKVALLLAAIIWGSSFLVVKGTVGAVSSTFLVGMRGAIAFVLLAVIFHRKLRALDKGTLLGGALMGSLCIPILYAPNGGPVPGHHGPASALF